MKWTFVCADGKRGRNSAFVNAIVAYRDLFYNKDKKFTEISVPERVRKRLFVACTPRQIYSRRLEREHQIQREENGKT